MLVTTVLHRQYFFDPGQAALETQMDQDFGFCIDEARDGCHGTSGNARVVPHDQGVL